MRTIIEVPDENIERLDSMAYEENISRAAVIREAIEMYLDQKGSLSEKNAFGLFKDHPLDARGLEKKLRSEWDDRL